LATSTTVSATNNADIDGLLSGYKWTGAITYSFPDSSSDYANPYSGGSGEPTASGFASAPTQMQAAINYAIGLILGYTNASISYAGTNGADIMIAQSPAANPTSYAYYPGNYAAGGDIWFGTKYNYTLAQLGNYYFTTALHELGHALGLKHSQETGGPANVAVPSAHDDSEYTVMSYRSYVGASTTAGYTNEAYGYPQTYMANDILAFQTLYGANYTTRSGSTVYTWSPTTGQEFINGVGQPADNGGAGGSANRIYETVWDGGGVDTYDLSNYTTNLSINLNPGASSVFSSVQLANLGDGHYASGNVYNAYLYNGDARSYIDNATGGSGNDTILGNAIANVLNGGSGNDTITGGGGNDTIIGGSGTDTAVYSSSRANYGVAYNPSSQTFTFTDLRSGSPDGTDTLIDIENFQFADGTITRSTLFSQLGPITVEAIGTTSLVQSGGFYYLNPTPGGTGPTLKYGGAAVVVEQIPGWSPIGSEQLSGGGYNVVWKQVGGDAYTIWTVDSSGAFVSYLTSMPGSSTVLETTETTMHQDLNGDGVIGIPAVTIESYGSTSLVQSGGVYHLDPTAGGTGPTLKYGGADVAVGQIPGWSPIGAEQLSGGGYNVVWKQSGGDAYTIWTADSSGAFVSYLTSMPGSSTVLETTEVTMHQDLNGDGTIGVPGAGPVVGTTIEAYGSTSLVQSSGTYYLNPAAGGTGPTLKYGGTAVVVGQIAGWSPIGAEQLSGGGYDVVWKQTGGDAYTIWTTDSSGAFVSYLTSMPGSSTVLETAEVTMHQDLNGDGTIGIPGSAPVVGTTIEAYGSTSLVQSSGDYYLNPTAGGTGPMLKYGGAAVAVGQIPGWSPIGAEQLSGGGYNVVWKQTAGDAYTIWTTDSNGAFASYLTSMPGSSAVLETTETTMHQDLNGDGTIGIPASAHAASTEITNTIGPIHDDQQLIVAHLHSGFFFH